MVSSNRTSESAAALIGRCQYERAAAQGGRSSALGSVSGSESDEQAKASSNMVEKRERRGGWTEREQGA